jgi:hypothetical protein
MAPSTRTCMLFVCAGHEITAVTMPCYEALLCWCSPGNRPLAQEPGAVWRLSVQRVAQKSEVLIAPEQFVTEPMW